MLFRKSFGKNLDEGKGREVASHVDLYLADLFWRMDPGSSEGFLSSVKLLSASTREGHVCLELSEGSSWEDFLLEKGNDPKKVLEDIRYSSLVGSPENSHAPLVLSGKRLYLHRYFTAEQNVAKGLLDKASSFFLPEDCLVSAILDRYFPDKNSARDFDMQKIAAFVAMRNKLSVIIGGPGTGKTSTICKILACLCELSKDSPEILLAAPTGKAASRLASAISEEKLKLPRGEGFLAHIPEKAFTLHRLLKPGRGGHGSPSKAFLTADILVVDEASMVDLFLMSRLVSAMKKDARLILLGDRFQLASVSPGAVLGEICREENSSRSKAFLSDFKGVFGEKTPFEESPDSPPIADSLVELRKNWRFSTDGGIGLLASLLNKGEGKKARAFLEGNTVDSFKEGVALPEISFFAFGSSLDIKKFLRPFVLQFFSPYLRAENLETAFPLFSSFGLLSFLRKGPLGIEALNALVREILFEAGLLDLSDPWYAGRPLMVVQNDPSTGLFNGDMGLCGDLADEDGKSSERLAFFPDEGGGFRAFSPMRLPRVEEAFCMTVHKSQGSEWDTVFLLLPEKHSPILTKEALYTGVTRAKKRLILAGDPESIEEGAEKTLFRASGLGDVLQEKDHWKQSAHRLAVKG